MAKKIKLYQWPPPVYVARFADGTECRMSVSSTIKGQYGFARARQIACEVIGNERGRMTTPVAQWRYANFAPASDLIAGHFEHDGAVVPDPFFAAPTPTVTRPKADPVATLIAKVRSLDWRALEALQAAIDERMAAA